MATVTPAPAATNAAVVETLNVPVPSPPVPTMSTASTSPTSTFTPALRIARAAPVSASAVTGILASAVRNAASSASATSPDMTAEKNPSHSSSPGAVPASARTRMSRLCASVAHFCGRLPVTVSRKFANCLAPAFVPIDSGWYCSDSMGRVLCLRPMISPSSLSAEISRQSGSVALSTASEW